MRETVEALIELQRVDDQIRGHKLQRDELAANLDRLKAILSSMAGDLGDKRDKLAEATRFYNEKQDDLSGDAERLSKAKQKLSVVTRTKEYAAMQRELDALRRKYTDDEIEIKRLSEAIEEYKVAIAAEEAKLSDLEADVGREQAASADRLGQLDAEIASINEQKAGAHSRLDPSIARKYARVLGKREGKAVVPASGGKCTGCQMRLPPQQYILVQRWETLQTCPSCQRFIFFEASEDEVEA